MIYTIQNEYLRVSAEDIGAQLQSIRTADGTEYLWQGDPQFWADRALNIFPFVARLKDRTYQMDGQLYQMDIHGFAPKSLFGCQKLSESSMQLTLTDNAQTYAQYPRHFAFRVTYALEENRLNITFAVENRDEKPMYFGLGGHPGFCVPLSEGKRFEDYRLRFETECQPVRIGFSADCLLNGRDTAYPLEENRFLPLSHSLFDDDAIVLKNAAKAVTLECEGDPRSVTVRCPGMEYLGIWHCPHKAAPYVCIEPWCSLPAEADKTTVFEERKDLIRLDAGKVYENCWSIEIN